MSLKRSTSLPFILLVLLVSVACGDSEPSGQKQATATHQPESAPQKPPVAPETMPEADMSDSLDSGPVADEAGGMDTMPMAVPVVNLDNDVIYQDEIYQDWPYTEPPVIQNVPSTVKDVVEMADAGIESAKTAIDKGMVETVKSAIARTHTINAEARVFRPDIIYINPGDTVGWTNMTSHNSVSVEGMIPEGAVPWQSSLGENLKITLDIEGVYAYVCQPHIGFGMVGLIIVGKPTNLDTIKAFADKNLQGPYRRLIGKLVKVEN